MKQYFILILTTISIICRAQEPTLEQKAAQMIMIGFRDTAITKNSHIVTDISEHGIGGVIIYEYDSPTKSRPRNITSKEQLKTLIAGMQNISEIPLFIGIDEEGGFVSRLKPKYGFKPTVSPQYLGKLNNIDSTTLYADRIANACKEVGINLNFAPLADVNINTACPVIGKIERSYSANTDTVTFHAGIFITEHLKNNIWCSIKHFPGHGSAMNDSHLGFTDVSDTWTKKELEPFKKLIADSLCPMIMTAHTFNSNIDDKYPATLSKQTISILRDNLKYNGLILSDDMMMLAIAEHYGMDEAIEKSINAGVDILLFSNNIDHYDPLIAAKAIKTITKLVSEGKILPERINESYIRIMKYKQTLR